MIRFDSSKESFSMTVDDMCGDKLRVSTDVNEALRAAGGIAAFNFIACDKEDNEKDDDAECATDAFAACLAFDREQLLAIRSAVDMILTNDEAVKIMSTPPNDAIKSPRQAVVETARKELAAMSECLYEACARWELDAAARLAWVYSMHPALDGRRVDMNELAEILRFVEVWDSSVDNYADCFKPAKGFTASVDDSEYDALSAVRQQVRQTMLAVLAIVDHLRAETTQSLGKSPSTT